MTPEAFELYYGGLYSLYSFANIFLPFISGSMIIIFIQKLGIKRVIE